MRELPEHFRRVALVVFRLRKLHRAAIELQGADAVAGSSVNHFAAAAIVAAMKFAGDHEAIVIDRDVRLRDGREQPPIFLVRGDRFLAELVNFIGAIELRQASNCDVECLHQVGGWYILFFQ